MVGSLRLPMAPRPPIALLAAALAAAALAAGCAPQQARTSDKVSQFQGDQRAAAQAVEDLESAAQDGDEAKLCTQVLAKAFADRIAAAGGGGTNPGKAAIPGAHRIDMTGPAVGGDGD